MKSKRVPSGKADVPHQGKADPAWLAAHRDLAKGGLPGVAYVRLDANAPWLANLRSTGSKSSWTAYPVAKLAGVSHRYGAVTALEAVDVAFLPAGCMVGLIGPDGVGKSSLLALVSGAADSGGQG